MQLGWHNLLGVPGRMLRRQKTELVFRLGKYFSNELSQSPIKIATGWAAGLRKDKSPFVDVASQARSGIRTNRKSTFSRQPENRSL